jgi:hypothetical protein
VGRSRAGGEDQAGPDINADVTANRLHDRLHEVSETYGNTAVGQPSQQRPTSGTCKEIALPCLPNPR